MRNEGADGKARRLVNSCNKFVSRKPEKSVQGCMCVFVAGYIHCTAITDYGKTGSPFFRIDLTSQHPWPRILGQYQLPRPCFSRCFYIGTEIFVVGRGPSSFRDNMYTSTLIDIVSFQIVSSSRRKAQYYVLSTHCYRHCRALPTSGGDSCFHIYNNMIFMYIFVVRRSPFRKRNGEIARVAAESTIFGNF